MSDGSAIRRAADRWGGHGERAATRRLDPLATFFALAFGITWAGQIAAISLAERHGLTLSNEANFRHLLNLFRLRLAQAGAAALGLFALGTAGPLLAALLVTGAIGGRRGLAELWGRIARWRVAPRWYLAVLALPLALAVLGVAAGTFARGQGLGALAPELPIAAFLPFFLYLTIFTGLAEEPGWRGFALPHLQRRHSAARASWILGPLVGLWHLPFTAYYNRAAGPVALVPLLVLLLLGPIGITIVNTWVYSGTASVFLPILLHGWGNVVQSYLVLGYPRPLSGLLYSTLLPWMVALVLLRVYGGAHLAAHPRQQAPPAPA